MFWISIFFYKNCNNKKTALLQLLNAVVLPFGNGCFIAIMCSHYNNFVLLCIIFVDGTKKCIMILENAVSIISYLVSKKYSFLCHFNIYCILARRVEINKKLDKTNSSLANYILKLVRNLNFELLRENFF